MTFEEWWKTEGQFIPPLDKMTLQNTFNIFKDFSQKVWSARDAEIEDLQHEIEDLQHQIDIS